MAKKLEMSIVAVVFVIIGVYYIFKEVLASLILIGVGITISPDVRNLIISGVKFIWNKVRKNDVKIELSDATESKIKATQQSGEDSVIAGRDIHIDKSTKNYYDTPKNEREK